MISHETLQLLGRFASSYAMTAIAGFSILLFALIVEKLVAPHIVKRTEHRKLIHVRLFILSAQGIILWLGLFSALLVLLWKIPAFTSYHKEILQALTVLCILLTAILLSRFLNKTVDYYSQSVEGVIPSPSILVNVGKIIIYIIALLAALQSLSISIAPILTALGVGGLAVALALQDTLSNLFSGLHIIASKQFAPGDTVRLENGQEGVIADITWRNTTIRTGGNNMFIVPNNKIATMILVNYCRPASDTTVTVLLKVPLTSPLDTIESTLTAAALTTIQSTPGAIPDALPMIRFEQFADNGVQTAVTVRVKEFGDSGAVRHALIKTIQTMFADANISIPLQSIPVVPAAPTPPRF